MSSKFLIPRLGVMAGFVPAIVRSRARSAQGGASPLQVNLRRPV